MNGVRVRWASLIVNDDDALRIPVSDTLRGPALGKGCGGFHTFLLVAWLEGPRCGGSRGPHRKKRAAWVSRFYRTVNTHQPPLLLCVLTMAYCVFLTLAYCVY